MESGILDKMEMLYTWELVSLWISMEEVEAAYQSCKSHVPEHGTILICAVEARRLDG
jgi:hypothetical protein